MKTYICLDSGGQYDRGSKDNIGIIGSTHRVHKSFGNIHAFAHGRLKRCTYWQDAHHKRLCICIVSVSICLHCRRHGASITREPQLQVWGMLLLATLYFLPFHNIWILAETLKGRTYGIYDYQSYKSSLLAAHKSGRLWQRGPCTYA